MNKVETPKLLGIDVGQSKTEYVLSINGIEDKLVADGLSHSDKNFVEKFQLELAKFANSRDLTEAKIAIGFTYLPETSQLDSILQILIDLYNPKSVVATGDEVTSYLGALGLQEGVVLGVGTGISCTSLNSEQGFQTFGGYGFLVSDEGSGYWIGRHGLEAAIKSIDGRARKTKLEVAFLDEYATMDVMIEKIYKSIRPSKEIAKFAQSVLALYDSDDIATQIIDNAITELVSLMKIPLELSKSKTYSLVGGLCNHSGFKESLQKQMAKEIAGAKYMDPAGKAVNGCLVLLKNLDAILQMNRANSTSNVQLYKLL
jgi:N-acetylglucosamine kinase-like BadF-type ATPase